MHKNEAGRDKAERPEGLICDLQAKNGWKGSQKTSVSLRLVGIGEKGRNRVKRPILWFV